MNSRFIWPLVFLFALRLAAQDVIVTGLSWVDPNDPPDTLPVAKIPKSSIPGYPEWLRGSTEVAYIVEMPCIDQKGKWLGSQEAETNPRLKDVIRETMSKWHFDAARRAGRPVNSIVRCAFIFNPACASPKGADAAPRLLDVTVPEAPEELAEKTASAPDLYVTAMVDAEGHVVKATADDSSLDLLRQPAENAVRKWSFAPARKNGQPVAQEVRVPVAFLWSDNPKADVFPRAIHEVRPIYPEEIRRNGWRGEVNIRFVVDIEGRVRDPVVVSSTNPTLNQPALDALLQWRFEPATYHGMPVSMRVEQPIDFQLNTPGGGKEPYIVASQALFGQPSGVQPVVPASTVLAVYPFELLRDGTEGSAEITFWVGPDGSVLKAAVVDATRPEFGLALLAMIDEWKFHPATKNGEAIWAPVTIKQKFRPLTMAEMANDPPKDRSDVPLSRSALDLLGKLRTDKLVPCPIDQLDAKPQLLSRPPLVFPSALLGKVEKGEAVIEFLIDRDGNVQLPRIVSATDPAFGYAAVQGVSAWKFVPPTSHGKRVVVRAQIPVRFSMPAPKPESAAAEPAKN